MSETTLAGTEAEQQAALQEVEKFITRIWEHPLLDEQTRQHRQHGKEVLTKFMYDYGSASSYPDKYFGVPFGSTRMITEKGSDYDFDLYVTQEHQRALMYSSTIQR